MTMLRPILRYDSTEEENIRNLTLTMQALSGGLRQCCIVVRFSGKLPSATEAVL